MHRINLASTDPAEQPASGWPATDRASAAEVAALDHASGACSARQSFLLGMMGPCGMFLARPRRLSLPQVRCGSDPTAHRSGGGAPS